MNVEVNGGVVTVKLTRFDLTDAERLHEVVNAFAPVSTLVLDFGRVTEFQDAAIFPLASLLSRLPATRLELRGVTMHQARLLRYARGGSSPGDPGACA